VFEYLKAKHNARRIYDRTYPMILHEQFKENENYNFIYREEHEAILPNVHNLQRKSVIIRYLVDSDYAGILVTRRSRI
jgi:hypothetical protein